MSPTLDQVYGDLPIPDAEFDALCDQSLSPRDSALLYDKVAALGLRPGDRAIDAGCRDGAHALVLARRLGLIVYGLDAVKDHIRRGRRRLEQARASEEPDLRAAAERVHLRYGHIEKLAQRAPEPVQLVWCRDVLSHLADVGRAVGQMAACLAPGGHLLVYQTFATELMEPAEAARLYRPLAVQPAAMDPAAHERAARAAGLTLVERDIIGSEWRERWEEEGRGTTSRQLLRIARMRRNRAALIEKLGSATYEAELADCHWGVYQLLGKLQPRVYLWRR